MKRVLTIAIAKAALRLSQRTGRGGGGALPGLIAEKLDPKLGQQLAAALPKGVILVTGTNGKTTTTKMLAEALERSGERVLTNRTGSNLRRGVLSSLLAAGNWRGRSRATIGLFEVDEASLRQVAPMTKPKLIVVLNLFRDQLDRYGELDTSAAMIGHGIQAAPDAQILLNADDPLVASLRRYANNVSYFGIEGLPSTLVSSYRGAIDSDRCPVCGARLEFSRLFYAHIGHYRCPNHDFGRPQPQVAITNLQQVDESGSRFEISLGGKRYPLSVALPGVYNLYNAAAAVAAGRVWGLEIPTLLEAVAATTAAFGRVEKLDWHSRHLNLLLIKNPTGFTQILETFLLPAQRPAVLLAVNDNFADGRDVSWLWDVPLELLAGREASIVASGIRAADMALRLKYAGVEEVAVEPDLGVALGWLVEQTEAGQTIYVLPTYTAMLALRKLLTRAGAAAEVRV